ncbi:MAG TPA: hypothetical protein VF384_03155 [Planctomycetota bacterium]
MHGAAQEPAPDAGGQGEKQQAEKQQAEKDKAALLAQVRALRDKQRRPEEPQCPFASPRLSSLAPAEVAWAAARLTYEDCQNPQVAADLIAALHRLSASEADEHRRAVLHVLHAALQNGLSIPIAELRFEPQGRTRIPWIALQTQAATKDGREVFALFHALDETADLGWEVVGGSLALRGHAAFAIELRTQMVPRLRVAAGRGSRGANAPKSGLEPPQLLDGFPNPPIYYWNRDKHGFVTARFEKADDWRQGKDPAVDPVRLDLTKLRWLARLAGEPEAVRWSGRFEVRFTERNLANFQAFSDDAEKRARESLQAVDLELRKRFKIPDRLVLPELEVVWEDLRPVHAKKVEPFPERRQPERR